MREEEKKDVNRRRVRWGLGIYRKSEEEREPSQVAKRQVISLLIPGPSTRVSHQKLRETLNYQNCLLRLAVVAAQEGKQTSPLSGLKGQSRRNAGFETIRTFGSLAKACDRSIRVQQRVASYSSTRNHAGWLPNVG